MKKTIILVFIVCLPILSNAQVSSYIIGGTSHGIIIGEAIQPGYNLGVLFDFPFSKSWSFQSGLNFNSVSTDSKKNIMEYVVNHPQTFNAGKLSNYSFLEIPATISTNIKLSEVSKMKFNAGGYFSIFTGGKSIFRGSNGYYDYVELPTYSFPIGGGFLFGTGIEINKIYLGIEANFNIPDGNKPNTVLKSKLGIRF